MIDLLKLFGWYWVLLCVVFVEVMGFWVVFEKDIILVVVGEFWK